MGLQAAVRVVTGAGQGDERGQVIEYTGDEVTPELAKAARVLRVVEQVTPAFSIPEAEVDVAAAADLLREGFGREAGQQAVL